MSDSGDLNYFKPTIHNPEQSLSFFLSYSNWSTSMPTGLCSLYSNIIPAMNIYRRV